jgi:hypothetical protein
MFTKQPFYHGTIRNITLAFGTLFNDLQIVRTNPKDGTKSMIAVPLRSASKNGWYTRLTNPLEGDPNTAEKHMVLPQMSFEFNDMAPDAGRQTASNIRLGRDVVKPDGKSVRISQFNRVSYRATFNLYVMTDLIEDGNQIIEQIVPYFSPSLSADIKEKKDDNVVSSIKFTLLNTTKEDSWEGDLLNNRRRIIWTLTFEVKFYFHGPITEPKIIKHTIIDVFDNLNTAVDPVVRAEAIVDPIEAFPPDPFTIEELYIDYTISK